MQPEHRWLHKLRRFQLEAISKWRALDLGHSLAVLSTSIRDRALRFYNAASIREPIDIYLNGRLVVSDLDYMNYTRYMHIIPGIYQLTVYRRTNPASPIVNTNIRLRSGYSYTLAVLGTFNDFSVQMLNA